VSETPSEPLADTDQVEADLEEESEEGLDVDFDPDERVDSDDSADPGSGGDGTEEGEEDTE
jgi:hypothetical protein